MKKVEFMRRFRGLVPPIIRKIIRGRANLLEYNRHYRACRNPFLGGPSEIIYKNSPAKIGIFREFYHYHKSYIAACQDLEVSYKLLDLWADDWKEQVADSGCDAFLVWPSCGTTTWKNMADDRIRILSEDMKKFVYPEPKALWLFENKERTREWLQTHGIPAPQTWLFYDQTEALEHANHCNFPLVYKTNLGASASGVRIIHNRRELQNLIHTAFSSGILPKGHFFRDPNWGRVMLQEYLECAEEWRMIRIGDSYFGYRKEKVGQFHSGSNQWSWLDPGPDLLTFIRDITELGKFTSMNVDVFRTPDGALYANELQAVFGATTPAEMLKIDDVEGRYIFESEKWLFEPGSFSKNQCSNLRVQQILAKLN